jgi:hypothetical protein
LSPDDLIFKVSDVALETYFQRRARDFLTKDTPKAKKHKRKYKKKGSIEPTEATAPTKPIKKLRNPCVPSSLRTAFRTFLTDGHVTNSVIEYLMGHNLTADLTKTYTNKSDDSWRETWKADCEPFLTFKV